MISPTNERRTPSGLTKTSVLSMPEEVGVTGRSLLWIFGLASPLDRLTLSPHHDGGNP
jgi:hypothetical protein